MDTVVSTYDVTSIGPSAVALDACAPNYHLISELYSTHPELIDSYLELVLRNVHRCQKGGDRYDELQEIINTLNGYGLGDDALTEIRMMYLGSDSRIDFNFPPSEIDLSQVNLLAEDGIKEMCDERIRVIFKRNQTYFDDYLELYVRSYIERWGSEDERWVHYHSVKNTLIALTSNAFVQRIVICFEQGSKDIPFTMSYNEIASAISEEPLEVEG